MANTNNYKLFNEVIFRSESDIWEEAKNEWNIITWEEDSENTNQCVCGHKNIKYMYTIKNKKNLNQLYPIGSSCIKKFDRNDMKEKIEIIEQLFKLVKAFEEQNFININGGLFSRKLLLYLYNDNAFKPTKYNHYDGKKDYSFMLDMFNARSMTVNQEKKTSAIILGSIRPYAFKLIEKGKNKSSS